MDQEGFCNLNQAGPNDLIPLAGPPVTVILDSQEKSEGLTKDLHKAGLKTTLPRLKVLSVLEAGETRHMSAEDVYREVLKDSDPVGLATVYRVLAQFVEAGLVVRHQFEGDKSVFELNDAAHHDHMVCVKCGLVIEFVNREIEALQQQVADSHQFDLQEHALTLYGLCRNCRQAS